MSDAQRDLAEAREAIWSAVIEYDGEQSLDVLMNRLLLAHTRHLAQGEEAYAFFRRKAVQHFTKCAPDRCSCGLGQLAAIEEAP